MALLLDVSKARPYDPAALRAALRRAGIPDTVTFTPLPRAAPRMRLHAWDLGDRTRLLRWESTGIAVARGAPRPGRTPDSRMVVAVVSAGEWTLTRAGETTRYARADPALLVLDDTTPFDFRRTDSGTVLALHFDRALLTLGAATLAAAARGVRPDNSVHDLVRTYIQQLAVVASTGAQMLPELHGPTLDLVRTLLLDAADDAARAPSGADTLDRVRAYVEHNLDDPGLCAETIAAAHNISARQLYKVWAATGIGLADHIIGRRLERSRETLRTHRHLTIAAVALRHGFSDPTHFAHRFRAAYDLTPSQWRADPGGAAR